MSLSVGAHIISPIPQVLIVHALAFCTPKSTPEVLDVHAQNSN